MFFVVPNVSAHECDADGVISTEKECLSTSVDVVNESSSNISEGLEEAESLSSADLHTTGKWKASSHICSTNHSWPYCAKSHRKIFQDPYVSF